VARLESNLCIKYNWDPDQYELLYCRIKQYKKNSLFRLQYCLTSLTWTLYTFLLITLNIR
jgi:hypothetical protein